MCVCIGYKRRISFMGRRDYPTRVELEPEVDVPGGERAPGSALREVESGTSLGTNVPGMRATGKTQVAVKTTP